MPCRHPDAAFIFADRLLALDHTERRIYALALHCPASCTDAHAWVHAAAADIRNASQPYSADAHAQPAAASAATLPTWPQRGPAAACSAGSPGPARPPPFQLRRCKQQYLRDVAACQEALHAGESYEICLTNSMHSQSYTADAWRFYTTLRGINPAPYSAWLHLGQVRTPPVLPARL